MDRKNLPIVLAVVGLVAAWYWSRRQSAQLSALLSSLPGSPAVPLPSRNIGDGYIDPITGGTGLPRLVVDENGDVSASLGTDLILAAIDPSDPTLLPDVHPVNGDLLARIHAEDDASKDYTINY